MLHPFHIVCVCGGGGHECVLELTKKTNKVDRGELSLAFKVSVLITPRPEFVPTTNAISSDASMPAMGSALMPLIFLAIVSPGFARFGTGSNRSAFALHHITI